MDRLSPFYPAFTVFVGALIVAAGSFWAAYRQSNFNAELRKKNAEITQLQRDGASAVTGGDSFAWAAFQVFNADGSAINANALPEDALLIPNFIHQGKFPLYDLTVRFADVSKNPMTVEDLQRATKTYPVGNLTPGFASVGAIRFSHHGRDLNFNIFYVARNGSWTQFLRMKLVDDGWATANKVVRENEVIYRKVSENYPKDDAGRIDWGEAGAQD